MMQSALKVEKATLKVSLGGSSRRDQYGEKALHIGELRLIPSGPNPLHN